MAYFVGLDSGGTKTECWLGDETRVLARATAGTVKLTRVSQEIATARLQELLQAVSEQAGVSLGEVTRTCVGVAGFSIAEVRAWAERGGSARGWAARWWCAGMMRLRWTRRFAEGQGSW